MTKGCQKFLRKAIVSGAASAILVAGLTDVASAGGAPSVSQAQQNVTINVAFASYPAPPKAVLAAFTKSTGIKVNYSDIQWDNLQTKIAAAAEAHTYFADVTDVDWSKVGEYYQTKWFMPLNKYFNVASLPAQYPQVASFIRNGELIGMPSDASLLVTDVNTKDFAKAGITKMPATFTQYQADLKEIQSKGVVAHPLDIPFAAAEGLSTYWYEMTAAFGGQDPQQLLQAGVHVAVLCWLQGDGVDGVGLQERPRAQGQPRAGGLPGVQRRPGRKPDGHRLLGLFR